MLDFSELDRVMREVEQRTNARLVGKIFGGSPRDPKRIPEMIHLLQVLWERNPDLRLGQLVSIAAAGPGGVFNTEDDATKRKLEDMLHQ